MPLYDRDVLPVVVLDVLRAVVDTADARDNPIRGGPERCPRAGLGGHCWPQAPGEDVTVTRATVAYQGHDQAVW